MKLSELEITAVRNLAQVKLQGLGKVNIFFGDNGAGKSTVLEAIHMLGLARSFRSTQLTPVIAYGEEACTVYGKIENNSAPSLKLGVRRERRGGFKLRVGGEDKKQVVALAEVLPIQLINSASYLLLEGGPKQRRAFVDWGVFHVEPSFYTSWKRAQRCIKQRNAILRDAGNQQELIPWDQELIEVAEQVDSSRARYLEAFLPIFRSVLNELVDLEGLSIQYLPGWDQSIAFEDVLKNNYLRDRQRGFTHHGPHRADLKISINGVDAQQILSRGQQKLVVSALRIAQSKQLTEINGKRCVMLVDDLPSEVDIQHQQKLCALFDKLDAQLFLTCIVPNEIAGFSWDNLGTPKLFHVKQGRVFQQPI